MADAKDNDELLERVVQYFEDSEDESRDARKTSEKARDYYDNIQLTAEERAAYKRRKQPDIVYNLIAPKIDFLMGVERQTRTSPKAFPRTPEHEDAANAVTDALRYVIDNEDFDQKASMVFENVLIEGTGGASVEVAEKPSGDIEIKINRFRWDRFFADPHSLKRDFSDARYTGIVIWKDLEDAQHRWPDKASELAAGIEFADSTDTYYDKPMHWWDRKRKRVMCIDMYFKHKQVWHHAIFAKGVWLSEPKPSSYIDEDGLPENPHKAVSAKVKRDGQRYGLVESLIDPQDEINKRRSKALHLMNTRQTFSKEGLLKDVNKFKKEAQKPDGHIEFPAHGEFGRDFGLIPTTDLLGPQFDLYLDAKQQMDTVQANAALNGKVDGSLSGKAIQSLQQGGMTELTPIYDALSHWKKEIYRSVWNRIKQFWREEKWVRVTDDEDNLRFVGLNQPITRGEQMLADHTGDAPSKLRNQFGDRLQQAYQVQPELSETVGVENHVAEMDVDIIVDEVPDVVNLQAEQFDLLTKMYQANPEGIPWEDVVEMSTLRNKDKILKKELEPGEQAAAQQQAALADQALALETATAEAEIESKTAKAQKDLADAEGQRIENELTIAAYS